MEDYKDTYKTNPYKVNLEEQVETQQKIIDRLREGNQELLRAAVQRDKLISTVNRQINIIEKQIDIITTFMEKED